MSTTIPVKKALTALLRDPGNSMCADCKSQSHPRWASWSLGVFICIKCAGVHRSLGTHVSKVKSVDLDTWKEEHLIMLIKMQNNLIANLYYECKLNDEIKKNLNKELLDSNKLQNFIKNKYEYKKWIGDSIPTNTDTIKENLLLDDSITASVTKSNESLLSDNMKKLNINNNNNSTTSNTNNVLKTQKSNTSNNSLVNLEKLSSSISNGSASNISSTTSINNGSTNTNNNNNNNNNNGKLNQRPDLKKSILSLYSKSNTNIRNPTMTNTNTNSINSSSLLNKISSNSSSASSINANNNWSPIPNNNNSSSKNNSALSLDDNELFKNVWS